MSNFILEESLTEGGVSPVVFELPVGEPLCAGSRGRWEDSNMVGKVDGRIVWRARQ